jgi:hypothetical protein
MKTLVLSQGKILRRGTALAVADEPCLCGCAPCEPLDLNFVNLQTGVAQAGPVTTIPKWSSGPIQVELLADTQPAVAYRLVIFFGSTLAYDSGPVKQASVTLEKPAGARVLYSLQRVPPASIASNAWTYRLQISCPPEPRARTAEGPGSELTRLLNRFWIRYQPGCKCQDRAAQMDDMGPEWCRENRELILSWMEEEARRRGIPYLRVAAELVLEAAISRAEARAASQ